MTDYNLREVNENPSVSSAYLWDWENINLGLTVVDGRLINHGDYVLLFATCTWGKGFKLKEDYKWTWKEGETRHLMLQFWQKPREVTDYKTKEKRTEQPSDVELFMGWLCSELEGGNFEGSLSLINSSVLRMCATGIGDKGQALSDDTRDMLASTVAKMTFIETEKSVWTEELMTALIPKSYTKKTGAYGSSSKGQTEAERISDRVEWLRKTAAEIAGTEIDIVTIAAIAQCVGKPGVQPLPLTDSQIDFLLKLMG
jgi:hypothetical protein